MRPLLTLSTALSVTAATALTLGAPGAATAVASAAAPTLSVPPGPTTTYDQTFATSGTQSVDLPAGLRRVRVTAVGGRGAGDGGIDGGRPALVDGLVDAQDVATLWLVIGGNAAGPEGGENGGGDSIASPGAAIGGGGGGASDVRTTPPWEAGSLESRLLVAAGGGGAGSTANGSPPAAKSGAAGGDAGEQGDRAESAGAGNTVGSGGYGGLAGTATDGGAGGGRGFPYGWSGIDGLDGSPGGVGEGGDGAPPPPNAPPGAGGGGGGGRYGGGGGGSGTLITGTGPFYTGGGGGGGGSSLVPPDGTVEVEDDPSSTPSVRVRYTIPGTGIAGPAATADTTPTFTLSSQEPGVGYQCRVDPATDPEWSACESSWTPALAEGRHRLEVRAVNEMDNVDPTPAAVTVVVDTAAPGVRLAGPGRTSGLRPTYRVIVTESPVTSTCRFDGGPTRACGATARPTSPLALGRHRLTVVSTDRAGNTGTATTVFRVVARVSVGRARLAPARGTAALPVTVNGRGRVTVSGAGVRPVSRTAARPGTSAMTVRATGPAARTLARTGRVSVAVKVTFAPAGGSRVAVTRRVTLRHR